MSKETVQTKDEVTVVLYDKDGKVKKISGSAREPKSKLEKLLRIIVKVLENW